jgi:PPK2 family polyphosphate:nucleotide phosphotransferase
VSLGEHDPGALPTGPEDRAHAMAALRRIDERLDALQEALYAERSRSVLVVLQGMDTAGKGGVIRRVGGLMNPQGLLITGFGRPTSAELRHDFLWRIRRAVPIPGRIGLFDRSHYEDVVTARVEQLVPETTWAARFAEINAFEQELMQRGITVVKVFLHLSRKEQLRRLLARLDDPHKRWKFDPGDLLARRKWNDYQHAYADAMQRCGSDQSPWYVVPADRKWYRNWCVAQILLEVLVEIDPQFPQPDFDIAELRARLLAIP